MIWPIRSRQAALIDALGPHTLKHFHIDEFACPKCGKAQMDGNFLAMLDQAREIAGIPFVINSGYRCYLHNARINASPTSSHLLGKACDISAKDDVTRFAIVDALREVGFSRIGISRSFVHCDNDDNKTQGVIWLYD